MVDAHYKSLSALSFISIFHNKMFGGKNDSSERLNLPLGYNLRLKFSLSDSSSNS